MTSKPRKRALQASFAAMAGLAFVLLACDMPLPFAESESPSLTVQADSLEWSVGSDGSKLSAEGPVTIRMRPSGSDGESAELEPLVQRDLGHQDLDHHHGRGAVQLVDHGEDLGLHTRVVAE